MFCRAALLLIALVASAGYSAEEKVRLESIPGDDLQKLFAGQELSDEVHFVFQFHPSGRLTGFMGEELFGKWRTQAGELCLAWGLPDKGERCYEVRNDGNTVRLLQYGVEVYYGRLTVIKR